MTKHLLILEPNEEFAARLADALAKLEPFEISITRSAKDACLRLMQWPHDLALIPHADGRRISRALRTVQPDLRLVVIMPSTESNLSDNNWNKIQGVLPKSNLDTHLEEVLNKALEQPFPSEEESPKVVPDNNHPTVDMALLIATLQQAKLGRLVQSTVFSHGSNLLAHWGDLDVTQAGAVASHVGQQWKELPFAVRIQFLLLPPRASDMLLYTRKVDEKHLLTLVALPETPVSELRAQSDPLVNGLLEVVSGQKTLDSIAKDKEGEEPENRKSYAIVWRPAEPLPAHMHIPLRRAFERLAVANACVISHSVVQSELVHLVIKCPVGRDSAWAGYLFKNGSEATIQQEFDIETTLWDTGYYATESSDPLSEAELNIFLEHGNTD